MTRYKLTLEYDGGPFAGWQRQDNGASVQQALEEAAENFCGERVVAQGAGRTDAGVHALGQVAHIDIGKATDPNRVREALNAHLRPLPIVVLACEVAHDKFNARFSATRRVYRYRIVNRRPPLAIDGGRAWQVGLPLDAGAMHDAAQRLVGTHDFTSFRAVGCQAKSPVKTLDRLDVDRNGAEIRVSAEARSFLHHQVRNMVGTLKFVGEGKWNIDELSSALAAKDRARGGPTAPAEGLYLVEVGYD